MFCICKLFPISSASGWLPLGIWGKLVAFRGWWVNLLLRTALVRGFFPNSVLLGGSGVSGAAMSFWSRWALFVVKYWFRYSYINICRLELMYLCLYITEITRGSPKQTNNNNNNTNNNNNNNNNNTDNNKNNNNTNNRNNNYYCL